MRRLVHVSDDAPGLRRERRHGRFVYIGSRGPIKDAATLARIRTLAIPPAYTDVWICRLANGHLQATGRDAKGRKQYRYHPDWQRVRDAAKFERLVEFARGLPRLRRKLATDLRRPGLPREKVVAAIVQLLQQALIRVGNEEYAQSNHSYGLTTLRNRHARVAGGKIEFRFRGKSGRFHSVRLADTRLARVVRRCRDIPGQHLFQYLDDAGKIQRVGSHDVNDYLRDCMGAEFSAKDFRTWAGTVLAARYFSLQPSADPDAAPRSEREVIERVAQKLGNTAAVCRKAYIHPLVFSAHRRGALNIPRGPRAIGLRALSACERAVVRLLERESRRAKANGTAMQGRARSARQKPHERAP